LYYLLSSRILAFKKTTSGTYLKQKTNISNKNYKDPQERSNRLFPDRTVMLIGNTLEGAKLYIIPIFLWKTQITILILGTPKGKQNISYNETKPGLLIKFRRK